MQGYGPRVFSRRKRGGAEPAEIYLDLRSRALRLDPAEAGIEPSDSHARVFGVVMDTGHPEGWWTLLALADGTTSLYLSSGGGTIGGGEHEQVAGASLRLVRMAEAAFDQMTVSDEEDLPQRGEVIIHALGFAGSRAARAPEDDLGHGRNEFSPVFHAAHDVITQLRLLDEGRR